MKRKMAIIFGLGGGWLDPKEGEVYLLQRYRSIGLITPNTPFAYNQSQAIYEFLHDADWRGSTGDSFGADYQPTYFGNLPIDYIAGFQPSMYASDVRAGFIDIPPNVKYAHCVRDPVWLDTGGLGYAKYIAVDPKKTTVVTTEHRGAHPDDFGVMQDLIFAEVKHRIGA